MKVGYSIALKILVQQHKKLTAAGADPEQLKSIAEGIESLCYPYREDLTETVKSPLYDPKDTNLDEDQEVSRKIKIRVHLSEIAWEALQYLRGQGVDC